MKIRSRCRLLRLRASSMLLFILFSEIAASAGYFAQLGRIYAEDGQEIQLRGISHFGFNSTILQPQYLWTMGWKEQIEQIKRLGFNAVRLPFAPDTLYTKTPIDRLSYVDPGKNRDLLGKTSLQALDLWMAEANRQGLYILLDFHSVSAQRQYPTWFVTNPADFGLVYNQRAYTQADWVRDLVFVAKRYAHLPYLIGIDLQNEPHGNVRWSGDPNTGNSTYSWKTAAEASAAAVLRANPRLLVFVQGVAGSDAGSSGSSIPINWGENLQPQSSQPLAIPVDKLVLSPHTYGPDVYVKSSFKAATFPANLAAHWEQLFGQFSQVHPVVVGEWGGRYGNGTGGQQDAIWQNALVDYLISKGLRSSFYWSYTPNSGDTGGILDDQLKVRQDKMALLRRLWGGAVATSPGSTKPPEPVPPGQTSAPIGISSSSPTSGSVGTQVTINGSGFSGVFEAWVGSAHHAAVRVISDSQVQVTVPAGATTGAIGLFTPTKVAFTATAFTVAAPGSGLVQPTINGFFPRSGPAGTVVTIAGRGFSGLGHAWVGRAQNGVVRVLSDTRAQVTVPPGATTGAIGIFNRSHAAFTPTWFVVQ